MSASDVILPRFRISELRNEAEECCGGHGEGEDKKTEAGLTRWNDNLYFKLRN